MVDNEGQYHSSKPTQLENRFSYSSATIVGTEK